ncbi:beta-1,4-mannosyltransferase [Agrococcus sp. UYP10]|uniref:glycosyltransferase n=1 Tax=Agrococcus sp. UYP10 TaxID=1756355 RepID=UPI00339609BC
MTARSPRRAPTVLYSVPAPSAASNPYTTMLARGVAQSMAVEFFSWRRALLGHHDILHVHWPETLVRGSSAGRRIARQLAGHAYLTIARARRVKIVRTLHNREPHEPGSLIERWFIRRLDRATVSTVLLSPSTEAAGPGKHVIPHGHYREWEPYKLDAPPAKTRSMLLFGSLRRYKGIEDAIAAFKALPPAERCTFVIAGAPADPAYEHDIVAAATGDPRITVDARRVPDRALAQLVASAACVVLPYRDFYNSGAALLALSLGTRIVAPRTPSSELLLGEFGPHWVTLYDGAISAAVIEGALSPAHRLPASPPDMRAREWQPIVDAHVALYDQLVGAR